MVDRKPSIYMIVDGGLKMGMGHVQQSLSLARKLAAESEITFLTKSDEGVSIKIQENGFPSIRMKDDVEIFERLQNSDPDVVLFDKIDVSEALVRDIRQSLRSGVVIFTNLTAANKYAHMAVTADIGSGFKNIRYVDESSGTLSFFGPKFWVLRPEFYEYKKIGKYRNLEAKKILLIFGGSDPSNLTTAALKQLLAVKRNFDIDVILGSHYGFDVELQQIIDAPEHAGGNVTVRRNVANVAELMFNADLVLASPGLSAFEALCVGTPVIVVPHDSLQRDTYAGYMRMLERCDLQKLVEMIDKCEFTLPGDELICRMEIGEGIQELKAEILNLARSAKQ